MERRPIDKGFIEEGTDGPLGKRKRSELTSFQSAKADSLAPILDQRTMNMWGLVKRPKLMETSRFFITEEEEGNILFEERVTRPVLVPKGSDTTTTTYTYRHPVRRGPPSSRDGRPDHPVVSIYRRYFYGTPGYSSDTWSRRIADHPLDPSLYHPLYQYEFYNRAARPLGPENDPWDANHEDE